ncbi:MAG: degT/DnrJ/EryC1/StrS aminotransferase [Acidobacteria bacterium]|nr:degT/DnrJ/EryC1/StrS aminotransferase [Acidobacteriota bacterium]
MEPFDTALVLTRVLTSGVVMSIEKSDRELSALQRLLTRESGWSSAVLLNSRTAAVHAALAGQGIGYGDEIAEPELDERMLAFVDWLGVGVRENGTMAFEYVGLTPANAGQLAELASHETAPAVVVDLTELGFGPAAALLTDDPAVWARAERLKIFGAYDLRTMWTQKEAHADLVPGVQFNYRLSPLVAACIRMAIAGAVQPTPVLGATA